MAGHQPGMPSTGSGRNGLAAHCAGLRVSGSTSSRCAVRPLRGAVASWKMFAHTAKVAK